MALSPDTPAARGHDSRERDRARQAYPDAYAEGAAAFHSGAPLSANPYPQNSGEHAAWRFGYTDAQKA
ncbi:MAG: hypothetical protein AAGI91_14665 [Bacteroidota bacterium]